MLREDLVFSAGLFLLILLALIETHDWRHGRRDSPAKRRSGGRAHPA